MFNKQKLMNPSYQDLGSHTSFLNRWYKLGVFVCIMIVLILVTINCDNKSSPTEPSKTVNGTLTEIQGISVLRIWGTPFEKGYAHGYLLKEYIVTMLNNFIEKKVLGIDANIWTNQVIPGIGLLIIEERFAEELQGMLAGIEAKAGGKVSIPSLGRTLTYADLVVLNVGADFADMQCSSFAGWRSMTTDSATIAGRNFDWTEIPGVFEKQFVIVNVATPGSGLLGFVSIVWPGTIGCFTVMNEEGVTLNINDTNGYPATQASGFHPRILIYREAIESAHAETALQDVERVLKSRMTRIPQNLMVTMPYFSGNKGSVVFEYDGNISIDSGATVREPEEFKNYQICTNHCRERKPPIDCGRYSLLSTQLEGIATSGGASHLTRDKAWELLESVALGNGTHHRVIFEPNQKLMHVALSVTIPAPQYAAVTFNVSDLLGGY